ncbi:lipase family protein [Nocardia sp. CA-128927]|uniref:lipase family protein n=1 Tax=Nocardia sp. CA-128927 TaxID=3239975 RepID=UPI003D96EDEC
MVTPRKHASKLLVALAVLASGLPFALAGQAVADPGTPPVQPALQFPIPPMPPGFDPAFYRPAPETYANLEPGQLIAARQVNVANLSLIPVGPVNDLVAYYAQDPNARVEYVRDHFSEHLTLDPIGAPRALLWLKDRFAGKPVASGVSTTDVGSMMLDQATWQVWGETAGTTLAAAFQQPIGSGR